MSAPPEGGRPLATGPDDDGWIVDAIHADLVAADPLGWAERTVAEQRALLVGRARELSPLLGTAVLVDVVERVLARVSGLGPLEPLLDDDEVTELMVNGDGSVWLERAGQVRRTGLVLDPGVVLRLVERIVAPLGRRIDRSSPIVDARLADGSRVNAIIPPAAVDGPCLTIRRFGARRVELDAFAGPGPVALLRWAVRARCNIVVSGGTGSGKTTLLNALGAALPETDRVITIEDTAELRLASSHVVRLESRAANAEGAGALPLRELVRNALRMRPDRIVVGEVRGAEVVDMLAAMNTGHEGSVRLGLFAKFAWQTRNRDHLFATCLAIARRAPLGPRDGVLAALGGGERQRALRPGLGLGRAGHIVADFRARRVQLVVGRRSVFSVSAALPWGSSRPERRVRRGGRCCRGCCQTGLVNTPVPR